MYEVAYGSWHVLAPVSLCGQASGADPQESEIPVQQVEEHGAYGDCAYGSHVAESARHTYVHHSHQRDRDVGKNTWYCKMQDSAVH